MQKCIATIKMFSYNSSSWERLGTFWTTLVCVCVCVCVYIYIYIYIHTHTKKFTNISFTRFTLDIISSLHLLSRSKCFSGTWYPYVTFDKFEFLLIKDEKPIILYKSHVFTKWLHKQKEKKYWFREKVEFLLCICCKYNQYWNMSKY